MNIKQKDQLQLELNIIVKTKNMRTERINIFISGIFYLMFRNDIKTHYYPIQLFTKPFAYG